MASPYEDVSLDDWKPIEIKHVFRQPSEWRKIHNKRFIELTVSPDDLKKINSYIKNKVSDEEIQHIFNIGSFDLKRIKMNKFSLFEENYSNPSDDLKLDIQKHTKKLYEDFKNTIRIEYNLSEQMFNKLFFEILKVKKLPSKRSKIESDEEE